MSPFEYRLEKILKYRISKKEEQILRVIKAQNEVNRIQSEIDKTNNTIVTLRQNMHSAPSTLLENYDIYINHLYQVVEELENQKKEAIKILENEKRILEELEKGIKALEKHKEKALEIYQEEQKQIEMKILDEVGSQKHFAKMLEKQEEEIMDDLKEDETYE